MGSPSLHQLRIDLPVRQLIGHMKIVTLTIPRVHFLKGGWSQIDLSVQTFPANVAVFASYGEALIVLFEDEG